MADFQSLLAKAVANLPEHGTPALRQAIYERARIALVNQLRRMNPPLSEADVAREENALQAAAQRLEHDIANGVDIGAAAPSQAARVPAAASMPPARLPARPTPTLAPIGAAASPRSPPPSPRAPQLGSSRPALSAAAPPVAAPSQAAPQAGPAPAVNAPPRAKPLTPPRANVEDQRPPAPSSPLKRRSSPWPLVGVVAALAAAAIAYLAWKTQERPQDIAAKDVAVDAAPAQPAPTNKIAERVKATPGAPAQDASAQAASPAPSGPAVLAYAPDQPAGAATARAAMLLEVRGDPQKPQIAVGSVAWALLPPTGGQAATTGVQAEIDVPELKLHAIMTIKKNVDPDLPATHTIDLKMQFADGAEMNGIKDAGLLRLRRDDAAPEEQVAGAVVKKVDGSFLIGLAQAGANAARNADLIATRNWFDFPLVLNDDRVAKLAFEKSAEGDKVMAQALAAWK